MARTSLASACVACRPQLCQPWKGTGVGGRSHFCAPAALLADLGRRLSCGHPCCPAPTPFAPSWSLCSPASPLSFPGGHRAPGNHFCLCPFPPPGVECCGPGGHSRGLLRLPFAAPCTRCVWIFLLQGEVLLSCLSGRWCDAGLRHCVPSVTPVFPASRLEFPVPLSQESGVHCVSNSPCLHLEH